MNEEEREAHYRQMSKMFSWGGWILAFLSLWLGSHLLTKMSGHIADLKKENQALRTELAASKGPVTAEPSN